MLFLFISFKVYIVNHFTIPLFKIGGEPLSKSRIEAFTDAVIAIIMTILVLEMPKPTGDTFASVISLLPHIGLYFVSFIILAIYWNNHHHLFQMVKHINGSVLWANNFFLLSISLIPLVSNWVSHYPHSFVPEFCYALILLFANTTYYVLTKQLLKINASCLTISDTTSIKNIITIVLNVVGIILGYFIQPILILVFVIITFSLWLIPDKKAENFLNKLDH